MAVNGVRYGYRFAAVTLQFARGGARFGLIVSQAQAFAGPGFIAGQAPSTDDPAEVDGRFRILNRPAAGRIHVYERGTSNCIASVVSNPDGTWHVGRLNPKLVLTVIGYDDSGKQNAAIQDWVRPAVVD